VTEELLDAVVPALLLQPLVENAIRHGIAPRSRPGHVQVSARKQDGSLVIEVSDDGVGLDPNYREGLALGNTRSRLQHLYGERQSFRIQNNQIAGVLVRVVLPLRFMAPDTTGKDESFDGDYAKRAGEQLEPAVAVHGGI
jgi:LytS/YehU family sensor histidine kinase